MSDQLLSNDDSIRIIHVKGYFMAIWLPMDKPWVVINEADLVLLNTFNVGYSLTDGVNFVRQMLAGLLGKTVPPAEISGRVEEFRSSNFIIPTDGLASASHDILTARGINDCQDDSSAANLEPGTKLKLSRSFVLKPAAAGFQVWSPVTETYHTLSIDLLLILFSFGSGKAIRDVTKERKRLANESNLYTATNWLVRCGFLIADDLKHHLLTPSKADVTDKVEVERPALDRQAYSGPSAEQNGRIPIYFVPHMSNHYPLGLGMLYVYIENYRSGALLDKYFLVPIIYMEPEEILTGPYRRHGPGIWLFSNYLWSIDKNLDISGRVKSDNEKNLTIHGGPSTPSYKAACEDFFASNRSVDVAVHGEGELTMAQLLEVLSGPNSSLSELSAVNGISFRGNPPDAGEIERNNIVRTMPRARFKDLDTIHSPYLSGTFDHYGEVSAAIIESNRGCPFGCTFCDWGSATQQKVRKFDLDRVKDEIEWIAANGVRVLWIADANFGMYERDIELAESICEIKERYGFPREVVVNYTKNATKRLAKIVEVFARNNICSQGVISIQTRDENTLDVINRRNIKSEKYNDLADIFQEQRLPLSTDLMIGLPGITVEGFKSDLQYYFDKDVTVKAYPTQLLPNSPMADPEYVKRNKIEVDSDKFLVSCFSYSREEYAEMRQLYNLFSVADNYSVLRYVLRFLQWDMAIPALNFLQRLLSEVNAFPYRWPLVTFVSRSFPEFMVVPGGWGQFYDEIADFAEKKFDIRRDSAFDAVLQFNKMVMPDDSVPYPLTRDLQHDVLAYFASHQRSVDGAKPLSTFPAANVVIQDEYSFAQIDYQNNQYDSHQIFWALETPVSRHQSPPNFI